MASNICHFPPFLNDFRHFDFTVMSLLLKAGSPLGKILRTIESFLDNTCAVEPISFVKARFFADKKLKKCLLFVATKDGNQSNY